MLGFMMYFSLKRLPNLAGRQLIVVCTYFIFGSQFTTVAHISLSNFLFSEIHIKLP